ncbi:MAG: ATP-binding protein [Rhodospirillales bacterium]
MKTKFVQTSNVTRFLTAVAALDDRAAPEACMALAQGEAGYGKTRTSKWWAMQSNAIFLRIQKSMTPGWLLRDLVTELGEQVPAHRVEKLFNQVISIMARDPRPIVIDEVERAIENISILENIRDISDLLEIPVILVGREFTWGKLKRHSQIRTRISSRVDFMPASLDDVVACVGELCEVDVADDVIPLLHTQSEGHARLIITGIKNIERIGFRNKGGKVSADMLKGVSLCQEVIAASKRSRSA